MEIFDFHDLFGELFDMGAWVDRVTAKVDASNDADLPMIRSANSSADPAAKVQPRWPCPVFTQSTLLDVSPM